MSPLAGFLIFIVSLTLLVISKSTKQFQEENIIYSNNNKIKFTKLIINEIEKEKVVAEKLNGRFAMMGFVALVGAYLTTGQIIPGFI